MSGKHKYQINTRYFASIDTPEKAYWLGFLWADGCISSTTGSKRIVFCLNSRDHKHLEQLVTDLDSNYPVKQRNGFSYLEMCSKDMFVDLLRQGIEERKTCGGTQPIVVDHLVSHFVRGLFDGDGSGTYKHIQIVGTHSTCEWLLSTTQRLLGIGGGVYNRRNRNCWLWDVNGAIQTPKLVKWLYRDATRYLERKDVRQSVQ